MTVTNDIRYVGVNDSTVDLFEGQYLVPNGISYNSYVISDEKIAVIDTVDKNFTARWLDNLKDVLGNRSPDYLIVQHMEPDHSAGIAAFMERYPTARLVANPRTFTMIANYFRNLDLEGRKHVVNEGDILPLGRHTLTFLMAPMVHWPEVMVTYDAADKVLFSADGFGKFGTPDTHEPWADEARRYYMGIVGKYGMQVQALLKKAAALDIAMICPLHGPVLQDNLGEYIRLYDLWSSYTPEEEGVVIAYSSVYGNTKDAALLLAEQLRAKGTTVVVHDLARTDWSLAVSDAFRYSKLVLAATTYNGELFPCMYEFIHHLTQRNYQNRTVAMMENGSWAPMAVKLMTRQLEGCKNLTMVQPNVKILCSLSEENKEQIAALADALTA